MKTSMTETTTPASRILVVDDHPEARGATVCILDRAGLDVQEATDGPEALERLRAWQPDLVLLDLVMPGMDGEEVLREIRKRVGFTETVVVLMTSFRTDPADQVRGLQAGADGYLSRPLDHRELVARVLAHLRTQELARELEAGERRCLALLAALPDGVLVVDRTENVRYANTAAEKLFGKSRAELLAQPFGFPLGTESHAEVELPTADGLLRSLEVRSVETEWDGQPAWLAIVRGNTSNSR